MNHELAPEIKTVFIPAHPELSEVSSSKLKELARAGRATSPAIAPPRSLERLNRRAATALAKGEVCPCLTSKRWCSAWATRSPSGTTRRRSCWSATASISRSTAQTCTARCCAPRPTDWAGRQSPISDIDHVLITHVHGDHMNGLEGFAFYKHFVEGKRVQPRHVAGRAGRHLGSTAEGPMGTLWNGQQYRQLAFDDYFEHLPLTGPTRSRSGPFRIRARRTSHHVPTSALLIEAAGRNLGYSSDTAFDPELIAFLAPRRPHHPRDQFRPRPHAVRGAGRTPRGAAGAHAADSLLRPVRHHIQRDSPGARGRRSAPLKTTSPGMLFGWSTNLERLWRAHRTPRTDGADRRCPHEGHGQARLRRRIDRRDREGRPARPRARPLPLQEQARDPARSGARSRRAPRRPRCSESPAGQATIATAQVARSSTSTSGLGADADPEALACWVLVIAEALRERKVRGEFELVLAGDGDAARRRSSRAGEQRVLGCDSVDAAASALVATIQGYFVLAATARELIPRARRQLHEAHGGGAAADVESAAARRRTMKAARRDALDAR